MDESTDGPAEAPPGRFAGDRLDSWKEIAAYLRRDVRTVQRWEQNEGLPVHRHLHEQRGSVYAFTEEIDAWRAGRQPRSGMVAAPRDRGAEGRAGDEDREPAVARQRSRRLLAAATLAVVATGGALWLSRAGAPGTSARGPAGRVAAVGRLFPCATGEETTMARIHVGGEPWRVVPGPDGSEVYVSNGSGRTVSVIRTVDDQLIDAIAVGGHVTTLAVSRDGSSVYAATDAGLVVIDAVTRRARAGAVQGPVSDLALTPDGRKLYLAMIYEGLLRLDTETGAMAAIWTLECPTNLALAPDGGHLYVNHQCGGPGGRAGHDTISVLDTTADRFVRDMRGFPNVAGPTVVSPDGTQIWANGHGACLSPDYDRVGCPEAPAGIVNVLRTDDGEIVRTLPFTLRPGLPEGIGTISFFPDGTRAVVSGDTLKVIDVRSLTMVERVAIDSYGNVAFLPHRGRAYVALQNEGAVGVLPLGGSEQWRPDPLPRNWWPADGTAVDIRGVRHGELRNGASFGPGRVGQAFVLDGVAAYVDLGEMYDGGIEFEPGAMSLWVKADRLPAAGGPPRAASALAGWSLVDRMAQGGREGYRLLLRPDARFQFCVGDGSGDGCAAGSPTSITAATAVQPGRWYHIVVQRTPGWISLFVDGVREASAPLRPFLVRKISLLVGSHLGRESFFPGKIDELAFYRGELREPEIKGLFRAGVEAVCGPAS